VVAGYFTALRSSRRAQFIGLASGGHEFRRDTRQPEEGKFHWRSGFVASTVAVIPAIIGESLRLMVMRWRYSGTWDKVERRRSLACLSTSTAPCAVRWPDLFMAGVIHGGDSCLIPSAIHLVSINHGDQKRESAHDGRRRRDILRWRSDPHKTLYHGMLHSVNLTTIV
jgi:hypothetical protein